MVLKLDEIIKIIKSGEPDWVLEAKKQAKILDVHINGVNVADHLNGIEGFENDKQKRLRKKFATSNRFVFSNLSRPIDKCFSAKGGTRIISTKEEKVKELLGNVRDGMSLKKWIKKVQANKYYSDPCGMVLFEIGRKGTDEQGDTYPTLKSICDFQNYKTEGRRPKWVCFEPVKKFDEDGKQIDGEFVRFIDGSFDYLFHKQDETITLLEDETYKNPWGYVPAIINSDLISFTLKYHESPFQDLIDIAEHYLRSTSVKNIYEFLHGYPRFWNYSTKCETCKGTGEIGAKACTTCNGTGSKLTSDVSDSIVLAPPKNPDAPIIAPNVAGYIQPDLETWREQREELKWLYKLMNFTLWGTISEMGENQTATEANLDVQPRNDRLNDFSGAFEDLSQKMIEDIVMFHYPQGNVVVSESWGRRFLMEPADVVWKKYLEAKKNGSPKSTLDYLLTQYYQTEFSDDAHTLGVLLKAMNVEPFVHKTDEEILIFPISQDDKLRKLYFNEWWQTMSETEILIRDDKKLKDDLSKFIKDKSYEISQNLPANGQGNTGGQILQTDN